MAAYPKLAAILARAKADPETIFASELVPYLVEIWLEDYARAGASSDIVQVTPDRFSYLFDVAPQRLIAAWGVSAGRHGGPRPASRMAGHPLSAGPLFHRGHAIAHTLGGGVDINLAAQRGSVNVGPFRELERRAVANPGSFYFTRWLYARAGQQTPVRVEQGLLIPGQAPDIRTFAN